LPGVRLASESFYRLRYTGPQHSYRISFFYSWDPEIHAQALLRSYV